MNASAAITTKTRTERNLQCQAFLTAQGWADLPLEWLGQDASTRRYARIIKNDGCRALLMDSPLQSERPCDPCDDDATRLRKGWYATTRLAASRVDAFVVIAALLRKSGFAAPEIYAADAMAGFCLLEDFGAQKEIAAHLSFNPEAEETLYFRAIDTLAEMHLRLPNQPTNLAWEGHSWPLQIFDSLALRASLNLFYEYYPNHVGTPRPPAQEWENMRESLIETAITEPRVFCYRDFHSENLLWRPEQSKSKRIGLLDFQDAIIGWDVWDLDLLLRDARCRISESTRANAIMRYCSLTGKDQATLMARWSLIGTLNALRIIGVFAKLIQAGRTKYASFMPEQIIHLNAHLQQPNMADMRVFLSSNFPELFIT